MLKIPKKPLSRPLPRSSNYQPPLASGPFDFRRWRFTLLAGMVHSVSVFAQSDAQEPTTNPDNSTQPSPLAAGEISLEADYLDQPDDTRYRLEGSVVIQRDQQRLEADRVDVNLVSGLVNLDGHVTLQEPQIKVTGKSASINRKQGQASIDEAELELQSTPLKAKADRIYRFSNRLRLRETSISSCPLPEKGWEFRAGTLELADEEAWGVAKNLQFRVKDVPVIYLPAMTFPVSEERLSGLLYPTISRSNFGGMDIATPYYMNLAPNYDATVTPRYIHNRGAMISLQGRHLSPQFSSIGNLAILPNDRAAAFNPGDDDSFPIPEDQLPQTGDDRWLVQFDQSGGTLSPEVNEDSGWYTKLDFTRVSDVNYFRNLSNNGISVASQTHLTQLGQIGWQDSHWQLQGQVTRFQNLAFNLTTPYRELPRLQANGDYRWQLGEFGQWGEFNWQARHEWVSFQRKNDNNANTLPEGKRARMEYDWIWDIQKDWGYLKPAAHLRHLQFDLEPAQNRSASDQTSPSFTVPQFSLDGSLIFERFGHWLNRSFLQTLEPRFLYFYSDYRDQSHLINTQSLGGIVNFDTAEIPFRHSQLFNVRRFAGGDRIEDANQLSLGVTTRLISPSTGHEWLSASIGQIQYFQDNRVRLDSQSLMSSSTSPWVASVNWASRRGWSGQTQLLYNAQTKNIDRTHSRLSYRAPNNALFNLAYQLRDDQNNATFREKIRQGDLSMSWPVNDSWHLLAKKTHDFELERELDTLVGFEYRSCCYRTRLVWRRWLDNRFANVVNNRDLELDTGVFFEITLLGLGSSSSQMPELLGNAISGWQDRQW